MKRGAREQLTKDNCEEGGEDENGLVDGSFKRANAEKMKGRRVLKARRVTSKGKAMPKLNWNLTGDQSATSSTLGHSETQSVDAATTSSPVKTDASSTAETAAASSGLSPSSLSSKGEDHDITKSELGGAFSFGQLKSSASPSSLVSSVGSLSGGLGMGGAVAFNFEKNKESSDSSAAPFAFSTGESSGLAGGSTPFSFGSFSPNKETSLGLGGGLSGAGISQEEQSKKIEELFRKLDADHRSKLLTSLGKIHEELASVPKPEVKLFSLNKKDHTLDTGVELKKDQGESGEEHENTVFSARVKLYKLKKAEEGSLQQWVDIGIGEFKLNSVKENPSESRLIMRMDKTKQLRLNMRVFSQMVCTLATEKSIRILAAEENQPVSYLLRFNAAEEASTLHTALQEKISLCAKEPTDAKPAAQADDDTPTPDTSTSEKAQVEATEPEKKDTPEPATASS